MKLATDIFVMLLTSFFKVRSQRSRLQRDKNAHLRRRLTLRRCGVKVLLFEF